MTQDNLGARGHTRLDSRQAANSIVTTIAHPL